MIIIRRQFPEKKNEESINTAVKWRKNQQHISVSVLPPVMIRKKQAYPRLRKTLLYTYYGLQRRLL